MSEKQKNKGSNRKEVVKKLIHAWRTGEHVIFEHKVPGHLIREIIQKQGFQMFPEDRVNLLITTAIWIINLQDKRRRRNICTKANKKIRFINSNYQPVALNEAFEGFFYYEIPDKQENIHRAIFYPGVDCVGDRISLYHEIGHSRRQKETSAARQAETELKDDYQEAQIEHRRKADDCEVLFRPYPRDHTPRPVDIHFALDYIEFDSASERGAWAYALEELREDRRAGIDAEPSVKEFSELEAIFEGKMGLGSYEEQILKEFPDNSFFSGYYLRHFQSRDKKRG